MKSTTIAGLAAGAALAGLAGWFGDRAPYPVAQHRILDIPLPLLSPRRVLAALDPRPGQRLLEIGPGTGLYTVPVADRLIPDGHLDVVDVQPEMLARTRGRLGGRHHVTTHLADATDLPLPGDTVDAALMVTVLGETADPTRVLRELARVLRPGARLVIGEFADRHHITFTRLARDANAAGFDVQARSGPPLAWIATLRRR